MGRSSNIGLWIDAGSNVGQVFWGKHSHRTSPAFKTLELFDLHRLASYCTRRGWTWSYIYP